MKVILSTTVISLILLTFPLFAEDTNTETVKVKDTKNIKVEKFDGKQFAQAYFSAWTATQKPEANNKDIEHYLSFYKDDLGHQHLPYSPDDKRYPDGKDAMREGMTHYLGGHSVYTGKLISTTFLSDQIVIVEYDTHSKGKRPNGELIELNYRTIETLELEDQKISVIRKYTTDL